MEKRPCPTCGVLCTGNYICLNCSGDAQHRQILFEGQIEITGALYMDLRDKFAMRALPAVIHNSLADGYREPHADHTEQAYAWADLMLETRKSTLPESR